MSLSEVLAAVVVLCVVALNGQRGPAAGGVVRAFPVALAQMENGVEGQMQGCAWQVLCSTTERGAGRLTVTGDTQCEEMVASIRCALAWARLHCKAIARLFQQEEHGTGDSALLVDKEFGPWRLEDFWHEVNR